MTYRGIICIDDNRKNRYTHVLQEEEKKEQKRYSVHRRNACYLPAGQCRAHVYKRTHAHTDAPASFFSFFLSVARVAWCRITCLECYFHFALRARLFMWVRRSLKVQRILQLYVINPCVSYVVDRMYCSPTKTSRIPTSFRCSLLHKMWSIKYREIDRTLTLYSYAVTLSVIFV